MTSFDVSTDNIDGKIEEIKVAHSFLRDPQLECALKVIETLRARLAEVEAKLAKVELKQAGGDLELRADDAEKRLSSAGEVVEQIVPMTTYPWNPVGSIHGTRFIAGEVGERAVTAPISPAGS